MPTQIKSPIVYPDCLTLKNLVPSDMDKLGLQSLSKPQRLALYNLCSILHLTFYDPPMRAAAQELRELIRKNTLGPINKCEFDKTVSEKKREQSPLHKHANP